MEKLENSPIDELFAILNSPGYLWLGHGTGRSGDSLEIIQSIFQNGLRTKDNSLYYTTIPLDTTDLEKLKEKLANWQHQDSKNIILIRLPIEYINVIGDTADLDGERFGAFFKEEKNNLGKVIYYLDPKFIVGSYDVTRKIVILNPNFKKHLEEDDLKVLNELYNKTLNKVKMRFKRQEDALNSLFKGPHTESALPDLEFTYDDELFKEKR